MTNERACANSHELFEYIQCCKDMATDISSLIESAAILDNVGTYEGGVTTLLKVSGELAMRLEEKLDSVNLPKISGRKTESY
ncbi:hypothetical protein SL1157_2743 [Ruegeria lacuscaerulensis ITI-1157]|nr:hypothetical protein SL1157_2743 [Ruegeria lacuscaerulensis ITI-1157]SHJ20125.1 hypothetical protein SAMN05444404_1680 [Ruegeria lacuscaerulensis ITI-1157]